MRGDVIKCVIFMGINRSLLLWEGQRILSQHKSEDRVDCLKVENAAPSSSPLNTISMAFNTFLLYKKAVVPRSSCALPESGHSVNIPGAQRIVNSKEW